MVKPAKVLTLGIAVILLFISRCGAPYASPTSTPEVSSYSVTHQSSLTSMPQLLTLTPTPTQTPTPTSIPSKTPKATHTASPTALPTPTLGPTMTNEALKDFLVIGLNTSNDCQLPCWWGTYPGLTPLEDVRDFFLAHGLVPTQYGGTISVQWRMEEIGVEIGFGATYLYDFYEKPGVVEAISLGARLSTNQRLTYNHPDYYEIFSNYTLPALLASFRKPSEVKVLTTQIAIESGEFPFYMTVEFPEQGGAVLYEGFAKVSGEKYLLCPHETFFHIYLWSPDQSDQNIVNNGRNQLFLPWEYAPYYKDLEEAAGISIDAFVDMFRNPQEHNCLITPINYWTP